MMEKSNRDDWLKKVQSELKGIELDELDTILASGLKRSPFYDASDSPGLTYVSRSQRSWVRLQPISETDPGLAHQQIEAEVAGGVTGLWIHDNTVLQKPQAGPILERTRSWQTLLQGIELDRIKIMVSSNDIHRSRAMIGDLLEQSEESTSEPDSESSEDGIFAEPKITGLQKPEIHFCWEPLGEMMRLGIDDPNWAEKLSDHWEWCAARSGGKRLAIDLSVAHNAGGHSIDELAVMLGTLNVLVDRLKSDGQSLQEIADNIFVTVPIDRDIFLGITKLRALRRLWQGFWSVFGVESKLLVHAQVSWRQLSQIDTWTNGLRVTNSAVAAVLGEADWITIPPVDCLHGAGTDTGRRFARNVHAVLDEECHLGQFEDPGAGSYFIEAETEALCQRAWTEFQNIEQGGGLITLLISGLLPEFFSPRLEERRVLTACNALPIIGVSTFADAQEPAPAISNLEDRRLEAQVLRDYWCRVDPEISTEELVPLSQERDSQYYELFRASIAAQFDAIQRSPSIGLLALGEEHEWTPSVNLARNFFASGGLRAAVFESRTGNPETWASRQLLLCICGRESAVKAWLEQHGPLLQERTWTAAVGAAESEHIDHGIDNYSDRFVIYSDILKVLNEQLETHYHSHTGGEKQ